MDINIFIEKDMFTNQPISDYQRALAPLNGVMIWAPLYYPQMNQIGIIWSLIPKELSQEPKY